MIQEVTMFLQRSWWWWLSLQYSCQRHEYFGADNPFSQKHWKNRGRNSLKKLICRYYHYKYWFSCPS